MTVGRFMPDCPRADWDQATCGRAPDRCGSRTASHGLLKSLADYFLYGFIDILDIGGRSLHRVSLIDETPVRVAHPDLTLRVFPDQGFEGNVYSGKRCFLNDVRAARPSTEDEQLVGPDVEIHFLRHLLVVDTGKDVCAYSLSRSFHAIHRFDDCKFARLCDDACVLVQKPAFVRKCGGAK